MYNGKYIIGLTGGYASGKTTVANIFKKYGFAVIDADEIAREVVEPGEKAHELIVKQWGQNILKDDGSIDREKMASIVFSDASQRRQLERILHPVIISGIWDRAKNEPGDKVIVMAPLLFETGMDMDCDMIITVTAPEDVRIERAEDRDKIEPEHAVARMKSQWLEIEKAARADIVIDTNCDMSILEKRVKSAINEINKRIESKRK